MPSHVCTPLWDQVAATSMLTLYRAVLYLIIRRVGGSVDIIDYVLHINYETGLVDHYCIYSVFFN